MSYNSWSKISRTEFVAHTRKLKHSQVTLTYLLQNEILQPSTVTAAILSLFSVSVLSLLQNGLQLLCGIQLYIHDTLEILSSSRQQSAWGRGWCCRGPNMVHNSRNHWDGVLSQEMPETQGHWAQCTVMVHSSGTGNHLWSHFWWIVSQRHCTSDLQPV
jgi:hypothetical protein